jgi:hypothetical protein
MDIEIQVPFKSIPHCLHSTSKSSVHTKLFSCDFQSIVFQSLELESKWVAALLSGLATLPSEEDMMADVQEDYQRMEDAGKSKRHTHTLWPRWVTVRSINSKPKPRPGSG